MLVLFEKMALLVIILAIGYICAKIKLVGPEFNKGLSKMVINVFLAGMILASVMNKELSMDKGDMLFGIAMLFVMQIVCFAVGMITPAAMRIKDGDSGLFKPRFYGCAGDLCGVWRRGCFPCLAGQYPV